MFPPVLLIGSIGLIVYFVSCFVVCKEQPRDLFLVVDDSASIGRRGFKKVRKFLVTLVSSVHVSRNMTRIGFLQFSDEVNTAIRFNLDNNLDPKATCRAFVKMVYHAGIRTRTDLALEMVVDQVRMANHSFDTLNAWVESGRIARNNLFRVAESLKRDM